MAVAEKDVAVKIRDAIRHDPVLRVCCAGIGISLEISLYRLDQFFGATAAVGVARRIDNMKPDMILDHFSHQA